MKKILLIVTGIFLSFHLFFGGEIFLVKAFSDVESNSRYYEAITYLKENGIVDGYPDGTFRPWNPVSRIELLKIVMNAKGVSTSFDDGYTFDDIGEENWYAPYVSKAYKSGYVNGNNGRFYPNNTVTKAECLKILFNIVGVERDQNIEEDVFLDVGKDSWYGPFIKIAKDKGYIDRPLDNYFRPHQAMNRGEVAEVMYRVLGDNGLAVSGGGTVYRGKGTYTISIGDRLYDDINDKYLELFEENQFDGSISFRKYDANGNKLDGSISKQIGSPFNGSYYEQSNLPLGPSLMNHLPDGEFKLEYIEKEGENRYKIRFDYAISYVYERAFGVKKILFVPVYLSDVRDKVNDYWKVEKYIIKPAFAEIQNYIKVKQIEHLGKEVMWFEITFANYVIPQEPESNIKHNTKDGVENRFDLVKKYTGYEPTDFDVIFFDIYTNDSDTAGEYHGHYSMSHQAYRSFVPYSVTEFDLNNIDIMNSQREWLRTGGLHEILHNFGMNDLGKNQGKEEFFHGSFFSDGSQICELSVCRIYVGPAGVTPGFLYIDDFIAHEIGWTDRNRNGVLDAKEYGLNCNIAVDSKYDFCKEEE